MTPKYDIQINKGSNFDFWLQYLTDNDIPINLIGYSPEFQINRFKGNDVPLLFATKNGVTYGYTAGFFGGTAGIGGISANTNYDNTVSIGGIKISFSSSTTEFLPTGKFFYDIKLNIGTTYSQRLLEGRVTVDSGVV